MMNGHSNSTVPKYYITPYTQLAVFTCLIFQPSLLFLSSSHGVYRGSGSEIVDCAYFFLVDDHY